MCRSLILSLLAAAVATPVVAQNAKEVLATAQAKQAERWETVDNYTVIQSINGQRMAMYFEKFEVDGQPAFRLVPMLEYANQGGGREMSAAEMREAARATDSAAVMTEGMGNEPCEGCGPTLLPGMNMSGMMRDYGVMLRAGATAKEEAAAGGYGRNDAKANVQAMSEFAQRAKVVGTENVNDRQAYLLRAEKLDDVDLGQPSGKGKFTLNTMSVWLDTEHYVPLRMTMDGTMRAEGKTKPITIERVSDDYRKAGPLYESYRQVMRISGMMEGMDPKERKKLEKARADMEKMEAEIDKMPAAYRGMMEERLKQARKQLAMMANEGAFESVVEVAEIKINAGPPKGMEGMQ